MSASKFSTNVAGKVKEIKLDSKKGYLAVFEVISNSIHSIMQSGVANGEITIYIEHDRQYQDDMFNLDDKHKKIKVKNITIRDNGEGFTKDNFDSFLTCYSDHKQEFGGKGVGRFTCLKVFDYVSISSVFGIDERYLRKFDFYPENELKNESFESTKENRITTVALNLMKANYADDFPTELNLLADLIIEHFFINFITGTMPKITLYDDIKGSICVNDYYSNESEKEVQEDKFTIYGEEFKIFHVKSSNVKNSNKVYLCADNRTTSTAIDLRKYIQNLQSNISSDDGKKKWYFAYVTSLYLDGVVNSERTELMFPEHDKFGGGVTEITLDTFVKEIVQIINIYLKKELDDIENEKKKKIDNYINNRNPKYRLLRENRPEFYAQIPNGLSDEKLSMALYKEQQNWEREIAQTGNELFNKAKKYDATQIEELKNAYMEGVSAIGKSCLTEYIVKRKAILDIFENAINQDPDTQKYKLEEVVHKLICPMISTSDELSYEDMNLWLIDEKLSYHYYLASDKQIKSHQPIISDSTKETDLAIYHASLSFNNTARELPFSALTIIEFKRPMRNDYDAKNNPIEQVKEYIDVIRAGKAKDTKGRPITGALENIPIYVYIIADITESLKKACRSSLLTETPDKEGYFRYLDNYGAYLEVMSYNKLYSNASQRNKVLFDKLFEKK